jgi:hypothetical protein
MEVEEAAGWIAPAATMVAAMMTASNLGVRVTGWGFAVFLLGSICWATVAWLSDQPNLLWTNLFLSLVNLIGIWRWLGRRARYEAGGKAAADASAVSPTPSLFPLSSIEGKPVEGADGSVIAHAVDAMAREDGQISYVIVREGGMAGVGERLHSIDWSELRATERAFSTRLSLESLRSRAEIPPERWPVRALASEA